MRRREELAKAVASLQKAVEYTALPDEAHLRLAQVYRRMGETEKARKESELYDEVAKKKKEKDGVGAAGARTVCGDREALAFRWPTL